MVMKNRFFHLSLCLWICVPGAAANETVDPLRSRDCSAAQATLEAALSQAGAHAAGAPERLLRARQQAIAACLGSAPMRGERSGAPEPPIVVAPTRIGSRVDPLPLPSISPPPAPPAAGRPAAITSCDPGGCWDSEGRRLNQLGPVLVGPQGACTVQGGVVACP